MNKYEPEILHKTTDYDIFSLISWNRSVKPNKPEAKKLLRSMKKYGFLTSEPIMVRKGKDGELIVFDGQHRLYFARQLGLPVYFVVDESGISIPDHQETNRKWDIGEHFERWKTEGKPDYEEVIKFSKKYDITIGQAASLLAGTMTVSNVMFAVRAGEYKVKARPLAHSVGNCLNIVRKVSKITNKGGAMSAIYACHLVDYFDLDRFKEAVVKNANMIVNCDGRDSFLDVFQDIYNHNRRTKVPLAFDAKQAMAARNAVKKGKS